MLVSYKRLNYLANAIQWSLVGTAAVSPADCVYHGFDIRLFSASVFPYLVFSFRISFFLSAGL